MFNPITKSIVITKQVLFLPTHYTLPDGNSSQILETAINSFTSTMTSLSLPTEDNIKVKKLSEQLAKDARELGTIFRTNLPTYATYDEPIPRVTNNISLDTIYEKPIEDIDDYVSDNEEAALQMKAPPNTKLMEKFQRKDCPPSRKQPSFNKLEVTQPNLHLRHPIHEIQYASGFTIYALNGITQRAQDITAQSYTKEMQKDPATISQATHEEFVRQVDETKCAEWVTSIPPNTKIAPTNPIVEYKYDSNGALQKRVCLTTNGKIYLIRTKIQQK